MSITATSQGSVLPASRKAWAVIVGVFEAPAGREYRQLVRRVLRILDLPTTALAFLAMGLDVALQVSLLLVI